MAQFVRSYPVCRSQVGERSLATVGSERMGIGHEWITPVDCEERPVSEHQLEKFFDLVHVTIITKDEIAWNDLGDWPE